MNIIRKHILRNIKAHKGRSFLIVFSLIVATAVLVLNMTLGDEIATKYEETLKSIYGKSDVGITMNVENDDSDLKEQEIKAGFLDFGSSEIDTLSISNVGGFAEINGKGLQALIMGMNLQDAYNMDEFCKNSIELQDNQVVVNEKCAKEYNIHKGDTISFTYEDKECKLEVVDIVVKYRLTALDYDYPYFISNLKTVNDIIGYASDSAQQIFVDVKDNNQIKSFMKDMSDKNKSIACEEFVSRESIEDALLGISSLLTIILMIVVIMIFFVVGSLNKLVIAERFPVIGTFRSVGATKGKMNLILLFENAIYGLVGGVIGSAVGYAMNTLVANVFITSDGVEMSTEKAGINWGIFFGGIIFAVLLEVVISLKAILRANRKPIKDIIFNVQSTRYKINKKKSVIGGAMIVIALLLQLNNKDSNFIMGLASMAILTVGCAFLVPVVLRLIAKGITALARKIGWKSGIIASKNIGYSKTIISSATLMVVSIASILTVYNVSVSFTRLFESFRYNNDFDVIVERVSDEYEKYDYIKDMDGVESVKPLYYGYYDKVTCKEGKKFMISPMFMTATKDNMNGVEMDDTYPDVEALQDNEILIDSFYAKKSNIKIGDKLTFSINEKELKDTYTVVGTMNSVNFTTSRNVILMNLNTYKRDFTKIPVWLTVKLKDDVNPNSFIDKLKNEIKEFNVRFKTFEEHIDEQEQQSKQIMNIFYIIIGLAVALSFVGIVNNQIIGFIQRKREIAILNSTCMSKGQIRRMIFTETLLSSLVSGFIACIVVIPMMHMVNTSMEGLSMCLSIKYNLLPSIVFVGIVVVILLLTSLIPLRKLRKMNVVSEIKYE